MELSTETKKNFSCSNKSKVMFFLYVFLSFFVIAATFLSLAGIIIIPQFSFLNQIILSIFICALFSFQIAVLIENRIRPNILQMSIVFLAILSVFVIEHQYLGVYGAMLCVIKITRLDEIIS